MRRPWLKFYPADWQSDEALGACGLAARGLWIEMLAIMHKAAPYGHLLVNGKPPTDAQLAALTRCPLDQIPSLLDELESAGVFSKTRTGVIYSRKLTRDEKRRKDGEKAAKEGALPDSRRSRQALRKEREKSTSPPVVNRVAERTPSSLEARSQNPEDKELSKKMDQLLATLGKRRPGGAGLPNYDDPAVRKARWQQKVSDELRRRLPAANAEAIIAGYAEGDPKCKRIFEEVSASMKARTAA